MIHDGNGDKDDDIEEDKKEEREEEGGEGGRGGRGMKRAPCIRISSTPGRCMSGRPEIPAQHNA